MEALYGKSVLGLGRTVTLSVSKEVLVYCAFMLIYKIMLDCAYPLFVPYYEYVLHTLNPNIIKLVESYLAFFILLAIIPKTANKFSYFANNIIFMLTILPMLSRYALNNEPRIYMMITLLAFAAQTLLIRHLPDFRIPSIRGIYKFAILFCIILIGYTFLMLCINNGLPSLTALNYFDVYEVRESFKGFPLSEYAISAVGNAILPFLIAISFVQKKYTKGILALLLQFLLYLYTGNKYFIFMVPLLLIVAVGVKTKLFYAIAAGGLSLALPLSTVIAGAQSTLVPLAAVYRITYIPAQIKFLFYDFTQTHPFLYFSEGQIGRMFGVESPYPLPFANMIGSTYFNDPNVASNTGYLADGYVQIGFWGIIIFAILFALIAKVVDSVSGNIKSYIVCALLTGAFFTLNDISLLTSLLTGGMAATILLVYAYNSKLEDQKILENGHQSIKWKKGRQSYDGDN